MNKNVHTEHMYMLLYILHSYFISVISLAHWMTPHIIILLIKIPVHEPTDYLPWGMSLLCTYTEKSCSLTLWQSHDGSVAVLQTAAYMEV